MDYSKVYTSLVHKALLRGKPDGYFERHHIKPRFLGGGDGPHNLVNLTGREHYIAHWLLYKIHKTGKAFFAWYRMTTTKEGGRYTSHSFQYAKERWSEVMTEYNKGRVMSLETRDKISKSKLGKTPWNKGKTFPKKASKVREEYESNPKQCGWCLSVIPYEKRFNIYCGNGCAHKDPQNPVRLVERDYQPNSGSFKLGHEMSNETKVKISQATKGMKRERVNCPHCEKIGDISLLKRWHFDNCKYKESS